MHFDVIADRAVTGAVGHVLPVRLRCLRCGAETPFQLLNGGWNAMTCAGCRATARQFVTVAQATADPATRRVGMAAVRPYHIDWKALGLWTLFLGPPSERRVPLVFEVVRRGLAGRSLRLRWTARRADGAAVAANELAWTACGCPAAACAHSRLTWWLPPAGVWDQTGLVCDARLTLDERTTLFSGRVTFDVALPDILTAEA